jgi:BON domain
LYPRQAFSFIDGKNSPETGATTTFCRARVSGSNSLYEASDPSRKPDLQRASRPIGDAGRAVKRIEGVDRVENKIHVLPVSPFDDQIRVAAFRAIYGTPELNRYAHQPVPPIHIIVENGRITLEGVVANESDRSFARFVQLRPYSFGGEGVFLPSQNLLFGLEPVVYFRA